MRDASYCVSGRTVVARVVARVAVARAVAAAVASAGVTPAREAEAPALNGPSRHQYVDFVE